MLCCVRCCCNSEVGTKAGRDAAFVARTEIREYESWKTIKRKLVITYCLETQMRTRELANLVGCL
jgi:hypothetical protein